MSKLFLLAIVFVTLAPAKQVYAQATQTNTNTSTGTTNRLSVTISNTNGVSSSATMTPNFDVTTSAKLVVGPGSTSFQDISDPTALVNSSGNTPGSTSSSASGIVQGSSSIGEIKYGEGTAYQVTITPKTNASGTKDSYSTAQGSANGNVTTQIVIDSTSSSFSNAFFSSF